MLSCWCTNPESRPLFDSLEKSVSKLLENGVAEHYIDLNEPYLKSNVSNFTSGQTDYLALMAAPDRPPPAIPNYVNGHIISMPSTANASLQQPNYLTMSPSVNSPTNDGIDTHFQFSSLVSPTTANNLNANDGSKVRNKISNIPEEIPMLKRSNQSIPSDSSDTELNAIDEKIRSTPIQSTRKTTNKPSSTNADSYVNVPSTIVNTSKKDAVSNPGYVFVSNLNETRT